MISLVCQASFLNRSVAEAIRKQTDCLQHIQHELYTKGQSFADNRDILNIEHRHRYGYWSSARCQCDLDCCPLLLIDGHCSPTATAVLVPATIFSALPTLLRALRRIFPKGSTCLATRSCRMDHVPLQLFVILLQELVGLWATSICLRKISASTPSLS